MENTHSFDASELMGRVPENIKIVESRKNNSWIPDWWDRFYFNEKD